MTQVKVTNIEDWVLGDDNEDEKEKEENKLSQIKEEEEITTSSKKNNKTKKSQEESESITSKKKTNKKKEKNEDKEKDKSKGKKKIKIKAKEREEDFIEDEDNEEKKEEKNKIYKELFKHMKNLQPDASKSIKKKTYDLIKNFVKDNDLDDDCYDLLIKGEDKNEILGVCELISKTTRTGSFKGSTHELLKIIHFWFKDIDDEKKKKMIENFSLNEDCVKNMKLGEHYSRLCNSTKKEEKQLSHQIIHIIYDILEARKTLALKDLIKSGFNDVVNKGLEKYKAALLKKKEKEQKEQEEKNKEINENEEKAEEHIKNMDEDYNPVSLEPRTWEAAEKLNKRILTCDFLASNRGVDDAADTDLEFIENFIDPLNDNKKLNIGDYPEEDIKKLHIQMDTFEPVFFLQKIYKHITLKEFADSIIEIDNNLQKINEKDEKLIDKNIYKYLDCKKLLDTMLTQFNNNSSSLMASFNAEASSLQNSINTKLSDIKKSFDQIIKSKMCKEILNKLSKYFKLKDNIEENLKFSNIDELADILKRVNVELKNISQNKLIYGEFYIYFSQKIDDFKNRLIDIIKNAPVTENVLKYFKYLLEFQLETETIEQLLNLEKVKMCDKIKVYLKNTENFEIKNYREFFCDEYPLQNINDEVYVYFISEAETSINENNIKKEKKKKIYEKSYDKKDKKIKKIKDNAIMEEIDNEKEELINVETIIKSILGDINEFLFTMKVLDEMISMKNIYDGRTIKFDTIATEIYFVLFDKLKEFLFDINSFDMSIIIKENYANLYTKIPQSEYINKIQNFYDTDKEIKNIIFNNKFNKNNLQNLSNLVVEIYEKFEYHLNKEVIRTLKENKTLFIKKIFYAFINEQINSNLSFFIKENTITYTDTQITIFNQSSFNFTKSFLQHFTQSYISIIKFYMNIVTKINNVYLEYDLIYDSFFFILKCFVFRFLVFYRTEKRYNQGDVLNLNCLVIETYRNINYIQYILNTLLKKLFRNKEKDYEKYKKDFDEFIKFCKNLYLKQYTVNSANYLVSIFVNNSSFVLESQNTNNNENKNNKNISKMKFYEKYNEILVGKNNDGCFSDLRSCFIDLLNGFSNCIRDLDIIFEEEKSDNKPKRIVKTLQYIISQFYEKFIINSSQSGPNAKIFFGQDESQKNVDIFKYNAQLLLEMQLLSQILKKYSSDQLENRALSAYTIILGYLGRIKGLVQENISESDVFTEKEIKIKKYIINSFLPNYDSFYKIFN